MKAVVQRVIDASVTVNGVLKGAVSFGLLVYLGVAREDTPHDADWLAEKIVHLRIFDDSDDKMNLSLVDLVTQYDDTANIPGVNQINKKVNTVPLGVLAISQFTLLGDARKGRRPSWEKAAPPEKARELYCYFMQKISEKAPCESGEFQARMKVNYTNDGPVTIMLDSKGD